MKAVLFDLFGTLVHVKDPTHPYRRLVGQSHDPVARNAVMTSSMPTPRLAKAMGVALSPQELADFEAEVEAEVARIEVYPDVVETLQALRAKGVLVFVSSNLAKPYAAARVHLDGLVDYWNFSFDTGLLKPDPAMFLAPASAYGVAASECLVVGDSKASDGKGAEAAGMPFILVDRARSNPDERAARTVRAAVTRAGLV